MMRKYTKHRFRKFWRHSILIIMAVLLVPQAALAQTNNSSSEVPPFKVDFSATNINYYDPRGNNICGTGGTDGGDALTRFLRALAAQESGGNIKAVSGTGAKGKYQYIDSTWKSNAAKYYPPASQYSNALDAPEEYQDAVAYIEYSDKYKTYGGDLFKLAISHFYPAANNDPSLLDIVPAGNVVSPRQYANQFIQKVNSGVGKDIPIKATSAPDFQTYLSKVGGNVNAGQCTTNGVVAGDIVRTALNLAWPNQGHGPNKEDATAAYQTAMPKYNPSSAAANDQPYSDCGVFVATVISATADPNYQKRFTPSQMAYIQQHPEKYDYFTSSDYKTSTAKLLPGDILIDAGHTYIFTGPYKGSDGKMYSFVSASWRDHVPQAEDWFQPGRYNIARVKK